MVRATPPDAINLQRDGQASLVLIFGSSVILGDVEKVKQVRAFYPGALVVGCSTAGEICDTRVRDDSLVVTAVRFEHSSVKLVQTSIGEAGDSLEAGKFLALALNHDALKHVLVLSDGLRVNGTNLARGLSDNLPVNVAVTGGLAGDGADFRHTLVCADGNPAEGVMP